MKVEAGFLTVMVISGKGEKTVYPVYMNENDDYILEAGDFRVKLMHMVRAENKNLHFCTTLSGERIRRASVSAKDEKNIGIAAAIRFNIKEVQGNIRVGVPSAEYEDRMDKQHKVYHSYMEDRLTGTMITMYDSDFRESVTLKKLNSAQLSEMEYRNKGEGCFLHRTDVISLGYGYDENPYFAIRFPYEEKEKSVALNAEQSPVEAFYPLDEEAFSYTIEYEIADGNYDTFTDALYGEYKSLAQEKERRGDDVVSLPFTQRDGIQIRKASVAKTYREFGEEGAGYFFHFNPQNGYGSAPSGFGSSFNSIPQKTYTHILEYGFTGRQIDVALTMAKQNLEGMEHAEKVIDFFVNHCVCKDGWTYSLYDVEQDRPFASFGDCTAPKLHYVSFGEEEGNYLRTMTEPIYDLLLAYCWFREQGRTKRRWEKAILLYASFLLEKQNQDGSWYRSYSKEGSPVFTNEDIHSPEWEKDRGRKASTVIPIPFLCALAEEYPGNGKYREAAVKAGEYTLKHELQFELYQGGTMDNPNIVDKEASQYVMAGMYSLYELTNNKKYLEAAAKAARQFVTWNYIWNAPMRRGTILQEKGLHTKGMGAINSIWCGGVVDIYSLFHIKELYLIGKETGEKFMKDMAAWISVAAHQILSWPGDYMGFTDTGMQPEGFGICPQGLDEDMIKKGDIWGTLGWIYSAGIGGMERYLECMETNSR